MDLAKPVGVEFQVVRDSGSTVTLECRANSYPPPKIDIYVSSSPVVEGGIVLDKTLTTSPYSSVLVAVLLKSPEIKVQCSAYTQYYRNSSYLELEYLFTTPPPPPPTTPTTESTEQLPTPVIVVPDEPDEGGEPDEGVEYEVVNSVSPTVTAEEYEEEGFELAMEDGDGQVEEGQGLQFNKLMAYIIGGIVAALIVLIMSVCLIVRFVHSVQT